MTTHSDERPVLGFWLYLMSDCVLFASLFATYAVLHGATAGGPAAADIADLPFVFIETLLLLASSLAAGLALLAARTRRKGAALMGLAAAFALGAGFLGMELFEFSHLIAEGWGPSRSAFLSAFFTLVGTHGLHVAAGLVWMTVVGAYVVLRGLDTTALRRLASLTLFWHFLDLVWICLFTFIYLFGALHLS